MPLSHARGHAQCDFGKALVIIGGVERKAHYFVLDLPHSDGCFVKAYPGRTGSFNCRKGRVECWIIGVIVLGVWRTVVWEESVGDWGPGLLEALREIEDPRKPKGVRHPLPAVLALSVCAMLSGARSLYAIAQWGREHPQFAQLLGFSRKRTPCVATLHHVFRRLDVDSFESALGRWAQECLGEGEATIAIDGKALRGIHGGELPGVRLVAAYAGESGLVLGQSGGQGWRQGE